jgi:hypothetical protein
MYYHIVPFVLLQTGSVTAAATPRIRLGQAYGKRPIRYLETWRDRGWVIKIYGIAYRGESPRRDVVVAAKRRAHEALPQPAVTEERYGIGFLVVHDGQDFCWALLDWWGHESVLHHRLFVAPLDGSQEFAPAPRTMAACVWELPVLLHERDAWVATVLAGPEDPDLGGYLERQLNTRV